MNSKSWSARKRLWIRILAIALVVFLMLGTLASVLFIFAEEAGAEEAGAEGDQYALDLYVLEDERAVQVSQTIRYVNRTGKSLDRVMFLLYPNIYRRYQSLPLSEDEWAEAMPEGFAPGGIELIQIGVNGRAAEWAVQGEDELFLRVSCSLENGGTALFQFDFLLLLPPTEGPLGAGDLSWRLTNFYPRPAVYDAALDEFVLNEYTGLVDPMYGEAGDYQVTVNLPENYLLAGGAPQTREDAGDGRQLVRLSYAGARDVSLVIGRRYSEYRAVSDSGVTLRALATTRSGALDALAFAEAALAQYEAWFGEYPFEALEVVMCEYVGGSASFTGLMLLDESFFALNARGALEAQIALHAARQWFSRAVGCDPIVEPWLQSALPEYVSLLYFEAKEGEAAYLKRLNDLVLDAINITIPGNLTVDSAASRFSARADFDVVVRRRGCAVLHLLRKSAGAEAFPRALRAFYEAMRGKNATVEQFAAAFNEVTGARWDEFILGEMHNISDYTADSLNWFE